MRVTGCGHLRGWRVFGEVESGSECATAETGHSAEGSKISLEVVDLRSGWVTDFSS